MANGNNLLTDRFKAINYDSPMVDPLLLQIEAFLAETGMHRTMFGLGAMSDSTFVLDLTRGRELRRATRHRALQQMAHYRKTGAFQANGKDTKGQG